MEKKPILVAHDKTVLAAQWFSPWYNWKNEGIVDMIDFLTVV